MLSADKFSNDALGWIDAFYFVSQSFFKQVTYSHYATFCAILFCHKINEFDQKREKTKKHGQTGK